MCAMKHVIEVRDSEGNLLRRSEFPKCYPLTYVCNQAEAMKRFYKNAASVIVYKMEGNKSTEMYTA